MKYGTFSFILNKEEYTKYNFKTELDNVLLKITKKKKDHIGEFELMSELNNKNDYVCQIYEETLEPVSYDKKLFDELAEKIKDNEINTILNGKYSFLVRYFIEDLGSFDLFDSITHLLDNKSNIWEENTVDKVSKFCYHMCDALNYLKKKKICHFDIKPENIMYNVNAKQSFGKRFKLIDFGFAEKYPFSKYVLKLCGTPFYAPYYSQGIYPDWALKLKPNDWIFSPVTTVYYHYITYHNNDYNLIYKTDVYSMGITFYQLIYYIISFYKHNNLKNPNFSYIISLINNMTHEDIEKRFTNEDCLNYFDDNFNSCCFF